MYQQQGDCLIKRVGDYEEFFEVSYKEIPKEAVPIETNLVLKGENNSHALYGGSFKLLKAGETIFIKVFEECYLRHVEDLGSGKTAEHKKIKIAPGEYFVDVVKERDHIKEETRALID